MDKKIKATPEQLDRLLEDIIHSAGTDTGEEKLFSNFNFISGDSQAAKKVLQADEHFSEEKLFDSVFTPDPEVEDHVKTCEACRKEFNIIKECAVPWWKDGKSSDRLQAFQARLMSSLLSSDTPTSTPVSLKKQLLLTTIKVPDTANNQIFDLAADALPRFQGAFGQDEDGLLEWFIRKDEEGNLIISFMSEKLREGTLITLSFGSTENPQIELNKIDDEQCVGAELKISKDKTITNNSIDISYEEK